MQFFPQYHIWKGAFCTILWNYECNFFLISLLRIWLCVMLSKWFNSTKYPSVKHLLLCSFIFSNHDNFYCLAPMFPSLLCLSNYTVINILYSVEVYASTGVFIIYRINNGASALNKILPLSSERLKFSPYMLKIKAV